MNLWELMTDPSPGVVLGLVLIDDHLCNKRFQFLGAVCITVVNQSLGQRIAASVNDDMHRSRIEFGNYINDQLGTGTGFSVARVSKHDP